MGKRSLATSTFLPGLSPPYLLLDVDLGQPLQAGGMLRNGCKRSTHCPVMLVPSPGRSIVLVGLGRIRVLSGEAKQTPASSTTAAGGGGGGAPAHPSPTQDPKGRKYRPLEDKTLGFPGCPICPPQCCEQGR